MTESRALHEAIFQHAALGLAMADSEGRWLAVNPAMCCMLGYTEAELLTRSGRADTHPDDLPETIEKVSALTAGAIPSFTMEKRYFRKDGSVLWVNLTISPHRDAGGRIDGMVLVMENIAERRLLDEAARRLAAIVESSDDAIIGKDLNGTITAWNRGAQEIFGYTAAEITGQSIMRLIPPERQAEEAEILARVRKGEKVVHFETVRRAKNGALLDVSLTVSPVLGADGRIIGASKIARDITERKRTDAALKDADRRKDEFLATLAHELRNPLAPIRNALQVMWFAGDRKVMEEAHSMVERQLAQMVRLVDDLLDVNRISRGTLQLRREPVELAGIVQNAVETARPLIEAGRHQLTVDLPLEPVRLSADSLRLTQVLLNLLNNASKYTPRGGHIWLTARIVDANAHANERSQAGGEVVITLRDDGIGIPTDMLERVFTMFAQIDNALDRAQGGLGVGLSLVKQLVELHGGSVTARSAGPGQGSEFELRLPLLGNDAPAAAGPAAAPAATSPAAPRRILVIDDNQDSADSSALVLELMGHETTAAYSGEQGLEVAARFHPEVMLLDIGLPGISGYEVAKRVRDADWGREVILIAVTGWGQEDDRRKSAEAGFNHHLVKPIDTVELVALLDKLRPA
jgi:PAS domain S-box-containing protein